MSLATELLLFPTSQSYRNDPPTVFEGVAKILARKEGCLATHHGLQVEDSKKGYSIVVWRTLEDHEKIQKDPDYKELRAAMELAMVKDPAPEMFHVHFGKDPRPIMDVPVTEVQHFTVNDDKTMEDFGPLAEKLLSLAEKAGALGVTWGRAIEKEKEYFALLGWESVEHHIKAIKESPDYEEIKAIQAQILGVAANTFGHTALFKPDL